MDSESKAHDPLMIEAAEPYTGEPDEPDSLTLWSRIKSVPGLFTAVSMVFFTMVMMFAMDLSFAVTAGFTLMLLIHELGHVAAFRYYRLSCSAPVFLPFMGAIIHMRRTPQDAYAESWIGLGVPIAGTAAGLGSYLAYALTGEPLFVQVAVLAFALNLFNLFPMAPLDGGRIVGAAWRGLWIPGLLAIAGLSALTGATLLMIALVLGVNEIDRRWRPLPTALWLALCLFVAGVGLFWHSPWACLPLALASFGAYRRWRLPVITIKVIDRRNRGEEQFRLLHNAIRQVRELDSMGDGEIRELWSLSFNGYDWDSRTVELMSEEKHLIVVFINSGYFDIGLRRRLTVALIYALLVALLFSMVALSVPQAHPAFFPEREDQITSTRRR